MPVELTIASQQFDSDEQLAFADNLSYNPWHALEARRPLGNQNRACRQMYWELSRLRPAMYDAPHVEPTGDEFFPGSAPLRCPSREQGYRAPAVTV